MESEKRVRMEKAEDAEEAPKPSVGQIIENLIMGVVQFFVVTFLLGAFGAFTVQGFAIACGWIDCTQ